jgi:hypothetical protein
MIVVVQSLIGSRDAGPPCQLCFVPHKAFWTQKQTRKNSSVCPPLRLLSFYFAFLICSFPPHPMPRLSLILYPDVYITYIYPSFQTSLAAALVRRIVACTFLISLVAVIVAAVVCRVRSINDRGMMRMMMRTAEFNNQCKFLFSWHIYHVLSWCVMF